jgi:uncharacterized protein with HEPN domain
MNRHPVRARDYIAHMLDAAQAIQQFVSGSSEEEFLSDRKTRDAVVRNLEILGEAAKKLSDVLPDAASRFPAVDFRTMYATRNRLIHAYAFINFEIIYEIALKDIPPLIAALESVLAGWPADLT